MKWTSKNVFLCLNGIPCISVCDCSFFSFHWVLLRRNWIHLLYSHQIFIHINTHLYASIPLWNLSFQGWKIPALSLSWYVRCSDPLIILVDLGQTHSSTSISNKCGLWSRAYTVCMQCKKPALFSSHLFWPFHIPAGIVARECFRKDLHVVKCMDSHCFEECL